MNNPVLPLPAQRHANAFDHEPPKPLIALIQGPLDK
jgi:hypothetical protein